MSDTISPSKKVLVEGKDEVNLFNALASHMGMTNIKFEDVKGKDKFPNILQDFVKRSDFSDITSLGIVRDADNNPKGAFDSLCSVLNNIGLPVPTAPLVSSTGSPRITILILPASNREGMLEDVCLDSVANDPALECVQNYFDCLSTKHIVLADNEKPKATVRAFLASREWMEQSYFEWFVATARVLEESKARPASISSTAVHVFLSSRYSPCLNLGEAAEKGYWPFDHTAFDPIKQFLSML